MALTKTNFMRGMQCPKMLWLDRHKPSLMVIPPEIQERLNAGTTNTAMMGKNARGINAAVD